MRILISWQAEKPRERRFLLRSRMSGGYWCEIVEDIAKWELQAADYDHLLGKIRNILDVAEARSARL